MTDVDNRPTIRLLDRPMIILLAGRPASGKTQAMKSIVKQMCEFKKPRFARFYVSTKFSGDFDFVEDQDLVFDIYSEDHLRAYVDKIKDWKRRNPKKKVPQNILCIDDALGHIRWYSSFWSSLISCHRHWGMNLIVATQSLTAGGHGSSTLLRNCVDLCVMYHSAFISTQKSLYSAFGGWFPSLKDFQAAFQRCTKDKGKHWAMVYQAGGEDIKQVYSAWKAELAGDFKLRF